MAPVRISVAGGLPNGVACDPVDAEAAGGATSTFGSAQFGRITTQAGAPRIIQLGVKYSF